MGSRLRPVPERVLECLIEVSAPTSESEGATLLSYYPETYEDVDMLRDVVPKFCFPFTQDAEMVDAVQHFTFVLTDIDGLYRFGFCRYPPKAKTCLCILSDLPAFDMFYGMLNTLAELENAKTESLSVKQFLDLVLESQVPEPGCKFTVTIPERDWQKQYSYPDPARLPTIPENRNLTDYFSAVNPSNMILLFASMMFERRIIVTSKKLSSLTACTYSASTLLYPMHWQHVFIPVIPPSLIDYCCAPMPFLVGVHSSLMKKVRDMPLDDVVILDVDKNEIEVPFDDLDNLPPEAVHKLNSALKKSTIAIGDYVSKAFLSAVVALIGGYRDALKLSSDTIIFEKELFVNSRPHMKPFLENLLTLQLFERFIHHRLEQLNAGKGIDDVFEEQVGLQTDNNSKWVSQYKQWLKNCKRDGSQLLKDISGKTEKARYKANKFIQSSVENVKSHSKSGWKEAMKGIREKKKNFIEYVKGTEVELEDNHDNVNRPGGLTKSNSLPMRKINGIKSPVASRKSLGSVMHNQILDTPPERPKKGPCPSRPPPRVPSRVPSRAPPRPPSPYKPPPSSDSNSPGHMRKSMCRHPDDPPIKDLIVFYDSQEELTENGKDNPFAGFKEYDYKSEELEKENNSDGIKRTDMKSNFPDRRKNCEQDLLSETMISLSDDTRQFLRDSRPRSYCISDVESLENGGIESPQLERKTLVKKTLWELALDHRPGKKSELLTHAESCPSLFDPLASTTSSGDSLRSSSSTNILQTCANGVDPNIGILVQLDQCPTNKNSVDPFVELITQRHNSKPPGQGLSNQNPKPTWVANFE